MEYKRNLSEYKRDLSFEKRKYPRVRLGSEVALKPLDKESTVFGWVHDISHGGFGVKFNSFPTILKVFSLYTGEKVLFETFEDPLNLRGQGDIRWVSIEENRAGIKFDELDDHSRRNLEAFLEM